MAASILHGLAARKLLARNMRRLRRERSMTQEQLSLETDLRQSYLSEIESAKRNVSIDSIGTIAHALGVQISVLFAPDERVKSTAVAILCRKKRT